MAAYLHRHGKRYAVFKTSKKYHQKCVNDLRFLNFCEGYSGYQQNEHLQFATTQMPWS
jgi:hypothetical protein